MSDSLLERAEKARAEARRLALQLAALRELCALDRDFRTVTRGLSQMMMNNTYAVADSAGLNHLIAEAEELLTPPPRV